MRPPTGGRRSAVALTAVGGVLLTTGLIGLGGQGATASSHREAPLIAGEPQYDNTDTYAFRSPDRRGTVTLLANWLPFEEPAGGPNFYTFADDARYDIKVDNDGDAKADVTFRWTFTNHYVTRDTFLYNTGEVTGIRDENLNFYQTYRLAKRTDGNVRVLVKDRRVAPSYVGDASMPDYAKLRDQATTQLGNRPAAGQVFAGQAEDPFFLDLRLFDLLYGGDLSETGDDTLAGFNVQTLGVQVPRASLTVTDNQPVIGVWSTTSRETVSSGYRQVSRLGNPLVNEVVIALRDKDRFNASRPSGDAQFLDYVLSPELAALLNLFYDVGAPENNRTDLVQVFLTGIPGLNKPPGVTPSEQLRLNVNTPVSENPDRLGVIGGDTQGYPNGRRLTDDVLDIAVQVVAGEIYAPDPNPNDLGDGVDANDVDFEDAFPYVALPTSGSDENPHNDDPAAAATGGSADSSASSGLPVLPLSGIGLGLLAVAGGMVAWVKRPKGATSTA